MRQEGSQTLNIILGSASLSFRWIPDIKIGFISNFENAIKGNGFAGKLLDEVTELFGDECIYLRANPYGNGGLSFSKLINYYKKHGFRIVRIRAKDKECIMQKEVYV